MHPTGFEPVASAFGGQRKTTSSLKVHSLDPIYTTLMRDKYLYSAPKPHQIYRRSHQPLNRHFFYLMPNYPPEKTKRDTTSVLNSTQDSHWLRGVSLSVHET